MKYDKLQLIFAPHNYGQLAYENDIQHQPPFGILSLASYINREFPNMELDVIDGRLISEEKLLCKIDSDIIGFSIWFSNYRNTLDIIKKIKLIKPNIKVVLGGPHASFLANRIMNNRPFIDYIIPRDGEIPLKRLLSDQRPDKIPGLYYRKNSKVCFFETEANSINLDEIPIPNLKLLYPEYNWHSSPNSHAMAAFPIAGIRGCLRKNRCEYCSIHFSGYRTMTPTRYWEQINCLHEKYGINFFFETGDIFSPKYLSDLSSIDNHHNISMRIYSYPGLLKEKHLVLLKNIGVNNIFMGIESVLVWRNKYRRKYKSDYSIQSVIDEINMLGSAGINVIPSFILGMPGEDDDTLRGNTDLISKLSKLDNVKEITVSLALPLPGSQYFDLCISNNEIVQKYAKLDNSSILSNDDINIYLLSELFIDSYTNVRYSNLCNIIVKLKPMLGKGMACWGSTRPYLGN